MAEAPKRLKLCDDAFGGWWQVSDDTPPEEVVAYVRADIAEGYRALNSEMLEALRSAYQFMLTSPAQRSVQALQDVQDAIGKADALAKGDEG